MRDREVVARGVALAPALLAAMTQPLLAAFHPVRVIETSGINAAVDGRVADGMRAAFMAQAVLDLLRRPVLLQKQTFDLFMKNRVVEFVRAVAGFTPLLVTRLRLACAVSVAVALLRFSSREMVDLLRISAAAIAVMLLPLAR